MKFEEVEELVKVYSSWFYINELFNSIFGKKSIY